MKEKVTHCVKKILNDVDGDGNGDKKQILVPVQLSICYYDGPRMIASMDGRRVTDDL